jgi:hypothetical protein
MVDRLHHNGYCRASGLSEVASDAGIGIVCHQDLLWRSCILQEIGVLKHAIIVDPSSHNASTRAIIIVQGPPEKMDFAT